MKPVILGIVALHVVSATQAQLLITQYYEGTSNNKWLELTNVGSSTISDLSIYKISIWSNANREGYKSNGTPTLTISLSSGSLAPGQSFLLAHSSAGIPDYATANQTSGSLSFNGDDSVALWSGTTFATSSVLDAIGFTSSTEGEDTSYVRLTLGAGWNTTSGSGVKDFSSVWGQVSLATVADAKANEDARLGYSLLTAVPEPHQYPVAMGGLLVAVVLLRRRRV